MYSLVNTETIISRHLTSFIWCLKVDLFQLGMLYLESLYFGMYVVVVAGGQCERVRPGPNLTGRKSV